MILNNLKYFGGLALGMLALVFVSPANAAIQYLANVSSGANYFSTGGNYQVAQSFLATANNLTQLELNCGKAPGNNLSGLVAICKGSPDTSQYSNQTQVEPCSGNGNILIATSSINMTCFSGAVQTSVYFTNLRLITNDNYYWQFISTTTLNNFDLVALTSTGYTNGQAYSYNSNNDPSVDFFFRAYYDDTVTYSTTLTVDNPVNGVEIADGNLIKFNGNLMYGDSLHIAIGPENSDPTTDILNVFLDTNNYNYDLDQAIPNGRYWVWYFVSGQGSSTIATTSLIVNQKQIANEANINAARTPISTSSAYDYLKSTNTDCATSAPAFISDPNTLWAEHAPSFLSNGTSTATNTPALYSLVTTGLYKIVKVPTDMANVLSCYLSSNVADQKGQSSGTYVRYWVDITQGINDLFPIPLMSIVGMWAIGMALWFGRKLLPFFK